MNSNAGPKARLNLRSLSLLGGVVFLLLLGAVNILLSQNNKPALEKMLEGATSNNSMFYLSRFIFPENIEIPFASTHMERYLEGVSIFPPTPEVVRASSKDLNGSDTVTIQYVGNNDRNIFKCDGTPLNPAQASQSIYFINAVGDLSCAEVISNQPDFSNAQVVVKNIDAMHILYGIDTNNDNSTDIYTTANAPEFSLDKLNTMKVHLLIRTFEKNDVSVNSKFYTLEDMEVGPYSDGYFRKTLTMVLPTKHYTPANPNQNQRKES